MSRNVLGVWRDSLLIINQLFEEYKCEHSTLTLYHTISINLIKWSSYFIFVFSVRGNNIEANNLVQHGTRYKMVFNNLGIISVKIID
jgi:hypothetical protein